MHKVPLSVIMIEAQKMKENSISSRRRHNIGNWFSCIISQLRDTIDKVFESCVITLSTYI